MTIKNSDITSIRSVLADLDPKSAANAAEPISLHELYAPPSHSQALDFGRPLIVGNRGAGKSVWSGALADTKTRNEVAGLYPKLGLDRMVVALGFHESAGQVEGVAPSAKVLNALLNQNIDAESIWTSVLIRAVAPDVGAKLPKSFMDVVRWTINDPEAGESLLRKADQYYGREKKKFLLVFDALDRLANNWTAIRPLTEGILRLSLNMFGFKNMHAKVFLRTDQEKDDALFNFPDASKIRALTVPLTWHASELYGLLFNILKNDAISKTAFKHYINEAISLPVGDVDLNDEAQQKSLFSLLAGEFMGVDHRRGRTYTWVIDHLADAFHETTPRSFLITLQRAALARVKPKMTVIDHHGIREGVQAASSIRVDQLGEDYPWIHEVLEDLEGLEVPCSPDNFTKRWKARGTVRRVKRITNRPGPIGLEEAKDPEFVLLESLKSIGVIEERSSDRINMPDLFRVAAKIKRRGGVRPPAAGNRHS